MSYAECFSLLGALTLEVSGRTFTTWTPAAMKNNVTTAVLPLRLLSPVTPFDDTGRVQNVTLSGSTAEADWTVYELQLWKPAASGRGLDEYAADVVSIVDAYTTLLRANAQLKRGLRIMSFQHDGGIFTYPQGNTAYFGVQWRIDIKDIFA